MKRRQVSDKYDSTKGPFDITIPAWVSDQSAMFGLKHKRHHYTAEQAHYCWYQVGWLGHVDVLRVSSFKQCVGFGARPQQRLLFEKSIGAKQFVSVKRIESAAQGRTRKQEHWYVASPCTLRGNKHHKLLRNTFSFIYAKALNHKFDALWKQIEPGLRHPTTGEQCSELKWKLQCFQEWYTVLHSHGWCIFYVQNQRGFLTFNFKSVYSAAVLRADKIS